MKKRASKLSTVPRCREVALDELDRIRGGAIVISARRRHRDRSAMKKRTSKLNAVPRCREVELRELDQIRGGAIVVSGPGDGKGPKIAGDPPSAP